MLSLQHVFCWGNLLRRDTVELEPSAALQPRRSFCHPQAPLETRRATYSYAKADGQVFIDIETFDEFEFSNEQLGERRWFLKENEEYKALRLDGRLLDIVLPPQIPLKVVDTVPPARTGLTTSWKEAKLETGLQIMVPLFIANGDTIRVDTAGKKYLGKE